jgi:hypothetical protein
MVLLETKQRGDTYLIVLAEVANG